MQEDPTKITDVNDGCWKTARAIHVSNVPVISACHGFILGGGILLAGASDIVLTTEDSYFGLPEIDRGALGGGAHLSRLFPLQAVRKMMFTGKPISAQRAYEYGSIESLQRLNRTVFISSLSRNRFSSKHHFSNCLEWKQSA